MHPIDAYRRAAQEANDTVPQFKELNTPEHERWLQVLDRAFARNMLKDETQA
jgi:hypothetical protein